MCEAPPKGGCFFFRWANFLRQGSLNTERRLKNEHEIIDWSIGFGRNISSCGDSAAGGAGLGSKK